MFFLSKIKVNVEGQTATSREIKFQYFTDVEMCGYVKLTEVVPNKNVLVNYRFPIFFLTIILHLRILEIPFQ